MYDPWTGLPVNPENNNSPSDAQEQSAPTEESAVVEATFEPVASHSRQPEKPAATAPLTWEEVTNGIKTEEEKKAAKKKAKAGLSLGKVILVSAVVSLAACLALCGVAAMVLPRLNLGGTTTIGGNTIIIQEAETPITQSSLTAGMDVTAVAEKAAPSVVEITTEQMVTGSFMQQYVAEGAGSGVIISSDGYIVTNHHVIDEASRITVRTTDGTSYEAILVGSDAKTDIAVLKIEATDLPAATLGNSGNLSVGDPCVAIGNPLGELGGTVTDGIISALDREVVIDRTAMRLLQTNAAVNPGNSGGGLFDRSGTLIAIVNAKSSGTDIEGLGFAVPINVAKPIIQDLILHGYVKGRVYMGITPIEILDRATANYYRVDSLGVYVLKIAKESPAAQTDLEVGDRIVSIDGVEIENAADLSNYLAACKVGQTIEIVVERPLGNKTISLTLGEETPETN